MDFEEIFENKQRKHGQYGGQRYHDLRYHDDKRYHDDQRYHDNHDFTYEQHHSYPGHESRLNWLTFIQQIRRNKKLKVFAILAGILILSISALLIVFLMPLIIMLINYVSENGLQGLMNAVTGFLDKLWKGLGK